MIKTLLFDIGDVLIDIDWQRGYKKMLGHMVDDNNQPLTLEAITEKLNPGPYGSIWDSFGMGRMTQETFIAEVIAQTGYASDTALLQVALTDLFGPLDHRIQLLNDLVLNSDMTIALVSDTNVMHMNHIEQTIPAIFENIPVERRFYSYRTGLKKKNGSDFYQHVLNNLNVAPQNAIMIDDRLQNKPGADAIGLHFLHIEKDGDLKQALSQYHIL